jgi:nucleoside-diphosphate-sugar epimerase
MIVLFNGASGGLGGHLDGALRRCGLTGYALRARLEDRARLEAELRQVPPDDELALVQLAARVSVPACEADPAGTLRTNVDDTVETVLGVVRWAEARGSAVRVVYVSSGHVYAAQPAPTRLREDAALAPRSVYARSKLLAEEALREAASGRRFPLLVARVFGLVGPRQPESYLLPALVRRVREGRLDGVPGLGHVRDWLDTRDVCDHLLALARLGASGPWDGAPVNVCSGEATAVRDLLREVVRALRPQDEAALLASTTEAPGRPDDVPWIVGDPTRLVALTAAPPRRTSLRETVRETCVG